MKYILKWCLIAVVSLSLFSSLAFADVTQDMVTTVYFEMNNQPYNHTVDYKVKCYGYDMSANWDQEGGNEIPANYDPNNPELVYSYSAACPEYGCTIYESYYTNYRHIDYCDLEGETEGKTFVIQKFATDPKPANCETDASAWKQTCEVHYQIPSLNQVSEIFSDVSLKHAFYDAIDYVKSEGIVQGYSDGTYKPDNKINRAEFTKIIVESAIGDDEITNCTPTKIFPDVPSTEWFAKYVCAATNHGIIQGYPNGTFQPANDINFVEAAKIIILGFEYGVTTDPIWYVPYVRVLEDLRVIPQSISKLDAKITRGEMAEMIYRFKKHITFKDSAFLLEE